MKQTIHAGGSIDAVTPDEMKSHFRSFLNEQIRMRVSTVVPVVITRTADWVSSGFFALTPIGGPGSGYVWSVLTIQAGNGQDKDVYIDDYQVDQFSPAGNNGYGKGAFLLRAGEVLSVQPHAPTSSPPNSIVIRVTCVEIAAERAGELYV